MKYSLLSAARYALPALLWLLALTSVAQSALSITSLAPANGPAGVSVTLNGSGFAATAAQNAVFVGQVRATVTAASATQLTATVPVGAGSPSLIMVVNTATGRQASTAAFRLTFSGTLTTASYLRTDFPSGNDASDVTAADVNADGLLDVLSASGTSTTAGSSVQLLLNGGNGQLQPAIPLLAGFLPSQVEVADLNNDALPDLVVGNTGSRDVAVLLGSGGGFASAQFPNLGGNNLAAGASGQRTVRVLDFDSDGLPDIAFIASVVLGSATGTLQLLRNTGSGFQLQSAPGLSNISAVETGDFNQDGRADLVGLGSGGFSVLLRNAANTGYQPAEVTSSSFGGQVRLVITDINTDGRSDVVVQRNINSPQGGYEVLVFLRTSVSAFAPAAAYSSSVAVPPGSRFLAVGDADGDGSPDILVTDGARLSVWRNVGGGQLDQPVSFTNPSGTQQAVAGDFDADGRTDIITTTTTNSLLSLFRYNPAANPNQNNAPTLNALPDLTLVEDAPQQTVALSGISNGGDAGQAVTLSAVSSDPSLVPTPTISYFSPTSTGTLRLQPALDAFGTCLITVTASDGQPQNGTFSRTFRVTVGAVNDAPTLDALPDVVVTQPASQITVPLSGITSGAANELQLLTLAAAVTYANGGALVTSNFTYTSPNTTGQYVLGVFPTIPGLYATVTLTVNDGQTTNNTFSRTFRIFYQPTGGGPANAPTLDPVADVTASRTLTAQLPVALAGITDGDPNQVLPLTVTAVSSDPALVAVGPVSYASPAATGSLPYTISATRGGTATVSVTVSNGLSPNGSVTRSFRITVPQVLSTAAFRPPAAVAVQLYPTPAPMGRFWLESAAAGPAAVTVTDLAGRVMWQGQFRSLQVAQAVQLPQAAAGVYVVRVRTATGSVVRRVSVE